VTKQKWTSFHDDNDDMIFKSIQIESRDTNNKNLITNWYFDNKKLINYFLKDIFIKYYNESNNNNNNKNV